MRTPFVIPLLLLVTFSVARAASPESVYSHFYLMPAEKASSGEPTTPEEAIASVHVIRPIGILMNGHLLRGSDWEENRRHARRLRARFRAEAEAQYRRWGVLKGELTPSIKADLDTLVDGRGTIVAITEPGNPDKLLQLVSIAYDGPDGLPLERRLRDVFDGVPRAPHGFRASTVRFLEQFGSLEELHRFTRIASGRPSVEGEPVEIKTFIKGYETHADWVPYILQMVIANDLARYGMTSLTGEEARTVRDARERQATVRVDDIWIEVIGEKLVRLYEGQYGFKDTGLAFSDPDVAGETVHLMRASRVDFENHMVDNLTARKGYQLVHDYGHVPMDIAGRTFQSLGGERGEGACLVGMSQLGRDYPPLVGTRSSIIPMVLQ